MKKLILYIFCLIFMSIEVFGQGRYTTDNKKAIKAYEEALISFNQMDFNTAAMRMQKAIKYDQNFIEAHLVLAEIYIESKKYAEAIESYKTVIAIDPDFFPGMYLSLAQLEMLESKFDDAITHLEKYLTYKHIKPQSRSEAKKKLQSCKFALHAMDNPVPFNPQNLGDSINTEYDEYWPSLTADEQTLVITRLAAKKSNNQSSGLMQNKFQEDFYISQKESGFWKQAIEAGNPLNTAGNEGAQTITVDGRRMYFTACNRPDGKGRCDIYSSIKNAGGWAEIVNLDEPVNSSAWEAQPSISSDGRTLFFVSNRVGGLGGKDIWYSKLISQNRWSKPVNLGDKVNTRGNEQSPFIHPDNKTLYFSSDGGIGMGGADIYKVTRNEDGTWTEAVNLGYPINSVHDEIGLIVNAKGDMAMFSSDRLEGKGRDIFHFELYKEARPKSVSYLKGVIFNNENKKKLQAQFQLINLETEEIIMQAESDRITGEFLVCIPTDNDYALNVSKEGYLFYSDNFSLKGVFEISDPFLKDIALNPIKVGEKLILRNVFFETDSYQLSKRSEVELKKLIAFLKANPTLKVEISGHTDNIGSSDYNQKLSENRAKSVYSYLVEAGVNLTSLDYKGYGEMHPITTNETEEGKAENRRTEVKIISK